LACLLIAVIRPLRPRPVLAPIVLTA